jgi:hypothetical protein
LLLPASFAKKIGNLFIFMIPCNIFWLFANFRVADLNRRKCSGYPDINRTSKKAMRLHPPKDRLMNYVLSKMPIASSLRGCLTACCVAVIILAGLLPKHCFAKNSPHNEPDIDKLMQGKAYVYKLYPEDSAGKGYRLVYMASVPLSAYWNFKTDFQNDFLLTNKLITEHRLVENKDNVVITETTYATKPGVRFRWRTIISPETHRLDFKLLNAKDCGKEYHYGHIQVEKVGEYTKVTQIAYFDFFGATIWMNYPWYGGMNHHLQYMVRWEQETVARLVDLYR